jgi:hypothetical protein
MKSNDGTQLEALVALIEGRLAEGFKIERRRRVFESGVQVAEFDIVISGRVGSADCKWLVECRDRPSEGAAPADWIEQLVGRRQRFRLNGVMAVSSTGFSPGAVSLAEREGIALRRLDALTAESVTDWLPLNAPLVINESRLTGVRIGLDPEGPDTLGELPVTPLDEKALIDADSGEALSVMDLWRRIAATLDPCRDLPVNGPETVRNVRASDHVRERYFLRIRGETVAVGAIDFEVALRRVVPTMPLVEALEYTAERGPDGRQPVARTGRWRLPGDGPVKEILVVGFLKPPEGEPSQAVEEPRNDERNSSS